MPPGRLLAQEDAFRSAAADLDSLALAFDHVRLPAIAAALTRDLRLIDTALAESGAALRKDPSNTVLQSLYLSAHHQKLELLRRATSLGTGG
jgi:hypothetical protein